MRPILALRVLLAVLALLLAACTQAVDGHVPGGVPSTVPTGFPATPRALGAFLDAGVRSLHSVELSLSITTDGRSVTAFGQQAIAHGRVTDVALTETIPDFGALKLVVKDGVYYAQLPPSRRPTVLPWVQLRLGSSLAIVRSLFLALHRAQQQSSLNTGSVLARATVKLSSLGTQNLDATLTTHYALRVSVARLPTRFAGRGPLLAAGVSVIPAEVWVDAQGRPRLVTEQFAVHGMHVSTEIRLRQFDAPVTITAPPRAQVSTR